MRIEIDREFCDRYGLTDDEYRDYVAEMAIMAERENGRVACPCRHGENCEGCEGRGFFEFD